MKLQLYKEIVVPKALARPALKHSMEEARTSGAALSIGELYAVPFAREVGAQPLHIGILTALSGVVAPFAQLYGTRLLEQGKERKRVVLAFVLLQALMWLPLIALAIALHAGSLATAGPLTFIVLYTLLIALGNVAFPAWFSWMGDLVPEKERGTYFSRRNQIVGIVGLLVVLAGAFIMDLFRTRGYLLLGFALLFACAASFRFSSLFALRRQYVPEFHTHKKDHIPFRSFLKQGSMFSTFSIYLALFNAALMFASPFFTLYMLNELQFSYVTLMLVTLSSTLVYLLAMPLMGRFSGRYGNRHLLQIANIAFIFSPLPWILIRDPWLLIIVPQLFAGVANAAFAIGVTNYTYDALPPRKRPLFVSYSNILVGVGTFVGALLGGLVLSYYKPSSGTSFFFLFGMTSLLRFLVAFIYLPKIKEVKPVSPFPTPDLDVAHPQRMLVHDLAWAKKVFRTP